MHGFSAGRPWPFGLSEGALEPSKVPEPSEQGREQDGSPEPSRLSPSLRATPTPRWQVPPYRSPGRLVERRRGRATRTSDWLGLPVKAARTRAVAARNLRVKSTRVKCKQEGGGLSAPLAAHRGRQPGSIGRRSLRGRQRPGWVGRPAPTRPRPAPRTSWEGRRPTPRSTGRSRCSAAGDSALPTETPRPPRSASAPPPARPALPCPHAARKPGGAARCILGDVVPPCGRSRSPTPAARREDAVARQPEGGCSLPLPLSHWTICKAVASRLAAGTGWKEDVR